MMEFLRRRLFTKSRARTQHREYLPPRHRRLLGEWLEERTLLSVSGSEFLGPSDIDFLTEAASQAPTGVDLVAACDTGVSDSDDITSLDNSDSANTLQFEVSGTIAGATVTLYADGTAIGSVVATGVTTLVATDGATDLPDGPRSITARQAEIGGEESADSAALEVTIDTDAPVQIQEIAKLLADDGASYDEFGSSVSISGTTAIVGAYYDDDNAGNSGSAYVFEDTGSGWVQVAKLTAADGAASDYFGYSVAISGNRAVVGAYYDDANSTDSGSAYVFEDTGAGWVQVAKLTADDGAASDYFGCSVSISDGTVVVGAYGDDDSGSGSGSAYVFEDSGSGWTQTGKLTAADSVSRDYFGTSVSISGNAMIVGAYSDDDSGTSSGSAYVFEDSGSGWVQTAKLLASDGAASDYFGRSVSINDSLAAVGAHGDDDNGSSAGSVYIFENIGSSWTQVSKLTAADGSADDYFGASVSITNGKAIAGAWNDESTGSAYLFEDTGAGWTQTDKLTATDAAASDIFGTSVSISGDLAVIGAYYADGNSVSSGSAYLFGPGELMANVSDDTGLDEDRVTSDTTPELTFTFSEAVYGQSSDVAVLDPNGNDLSPDSISGWGSKTLAVSFSTPLILDGEYLVTLNASSPITDAAGNAISDGESETLAFTLDTVAPAVPASLDLQASSDTGVYDDDNTTSDVTPTFEVTASPYFRVYRDGVQISDDFESGNSYTPVVQADGTYAYTVTAVDAAGNESNSSAELTVIIDATDPDIPDAPDLQAGSDTGASDSDDVTSDITPTLDVDASPYFRVYRDGIQISGDYETGSNYTLEPQANGTYEFSVNSVDAAGNSSAQSVSLTLTIDNASPVLNQQFEAIAELLASDGVSGDRLGYSVSIDGSTAIVGAYCDDDDGSSSGSAYIFQETASGWVQVAKLIADDSAKYDRFGYSVSISGNTALVGAPYDDDNGSSSGSAYVFEKTTCGWGQVAKLTAADGASADYFGRSVSIDEDMLIVGAYYDDDDGANSGSAYVFKDAASGWTQVAKLTADDGAEYGQFGCSVAISAGVVVVGADGAENHSAYVFRDTASGWIQEAKLTGSNGWSSGHFGSSVAIDGGIVVVGAYGDSDLGYYAGAAYVFEDTGAGWTEVVKLTAADGATGDVFGCSVSVDGGTVLIGAYGDDDDGISSGSAYIFEASDFRWAQVAKVTSPDAAASDVFGASVSISGDRPFVGAYGNGHGSAHVFAYVPPLSDDTGVDGDDQFTSDTTPTLTLVFNEVILGQDTAVTVLDPSGVPVTPDLIAGWGTDTLAISFSTPLTVDGKYTVALNGTTVITDTAGNAFNNGATESVVFTLDTAASVVPSAPDLQAASDLGVSDSDDYTGDTTPTLEVDATPYFRIYRDGVQISDDYEAGSTYTLETQGSGTYEYAVTAVDAAGNESAASDALTVTIDAEHPLLDTAELSDDTGVSSSDLITNDTTPELVFLFSEPICGEDSDLTILDPNGDPVAPDSITGWGTDTLTVSFSTALTVDGEHTVTLNATNAIVDEAGNSLNNGVNETVIFTVDTVAPSTPSLPDLSVASDTGASRSDNITYATTLRFFATGSPYYRLYRDGVQVSGDYESEVSVDTVGDEGVYGYTLIAVDAAGNQSLPSETLNVTLDTIAPAVPDAADLQPESDQGPSDNDNLTNDRTPTFDVNVAPYFRVYRDGVQVSDDFETSASYTAPRQGDGVCEYTVTAVDAAGNESAASDALVVTVDTEHVFLLTAELTDDTGLNAEDRVTNDATPELTFTFTEAVYGEDSDVAVLDPNDAPVTPDSITGWGTDTLTLLFSTPLAVDGRYTATLDAEALTDGAGNSLNYGVDVSRSFSIDTAAPPDPDALDLQTDSDTGVSNSDNITSDTTPTFDVIASPYFRVYRDGVQISGDFETGSTYTVAPQADGTYVYTVTAVDGAGNESEPSGTLTVTIDTDAPAAPAAPDLQAGSDTGMSDSDNITNDSTPTFDVSAVAYFRLYRNGVQISGDYEVGSCTVSSPEDGAYEYTVTAVDAAGNESTHGIALTVTIDTATPVQYDRFEQITKLLAGDGAEDDRFGYSVSIDGNTAIVGAFCDDDDGSGSGSAYIFENDGAGWLQVAKLTASDAAHYDQFGYSVSIDGSTAIVGATGDDSHGDCSGAAYVFADTGSGWSQVAKLTASDGAESDYLGYSVSISGDTAIVGSRWDDDNGAMSGSAYVFQDTGSRWAQVAKLTADDGAPYDQFSYSVSISGAIAIVGALGNGVAGSAYIFEDGGSGWTQVAKLSPSDGSWDDLFGRSVSISGNTAIVGAYGKDDSGEDSGAAYIFTDAGSGWSLVAKLTADDAAADDCFGYSVSIDGSLAIVGAYYDDDNGADSGSAYIFEETGSAWLQVAKVTADDGTVSDYLGRSVAISGDRAVVGAWGDDDNGSNAGSTYVYSLSNILDLQAGSDTGESDIDNITADNTPTFASSAAPYFRLYRDGLQVSGNYESGSYIEAALADGTYEYTLATVDVAGNESVQTTALLVTIDTAAPLSPPSAPDLQSDSDTGASDTDDVTNDNTPTFDATGAPYFRVYCDGVQISGDYESGNFTADAQEDGTHEYTVTAVDATGNESAPSAALIVTIDTEASAAPAAPDLQAGSDTGASDSDNITSDTTPTFDVDAAPYFRLYRDGIQISGDYELEGCCTTILQADGTFDYTVRTVDAAGNESADSAVLSVVIDTTSPVQIGQIAKLLAGDGEASDRFGYSVAISGTTAIVGAYGEDDNGVDSGAAYVFEKTELGWTHVAKLTADDGADEDYFGFAVSISGGTAIVGAYGDDDNGSNSGSAYLFQDTGAGWTQIAKLTPDDAGTYDLFGRSVAISDGTAVVGAYGDYTNGSYSGSAYVFEDTGSGWSQAAKLTADDGAAFDYFGDTVSINGNTAIVGARGDDDNGRDSGSAYLFENANSEWTCIAKLTANDGAAGDLFGWSVAVSDGTAVVGAQSDDDNGSNSGSVYLFQDTGAGWSQIAKLTPDDGAESDAFGRSVAISGNTVVIGAPGDDDNGSSSGSAYIFEGSASTWTQIAKLTAADGAAGDYFGGSVSISGDTTVVGAYFDYFWSGSTYVFRRADQLTGQLTDDTGSNTTDRLTSDTTPELAFTFSEPVYGLGAAVTVLDPNGDPVTPDSISGWGTNTLTVTFSTALAADGEYTLTVNETSAITDTAGNAFNDGAPQSTTFTLDATAPTIDLAITSPTADTSPSVTVTATDALTGMADGTEVHLDVDLNNDGDFLDDGETSYMTATLTGGTATFEILPELAPGTYLLQARVADAAGNEGTSDTVELTVAVTLEGTDGADTILVWLGTPGGAVHSVSINGTVTTYDPSAISAFYIDGLSGNDTITVYATDEDETVAVQPGSVDIVGETYELHATGVEKVTVDAGDGHDQVALTGSSGSNRLYSHADHTILTDLPRTFYCRVDGFDTATADLPAEGAGTAYFYDSPNDDALIGTPEAVTLTWAVGTTEATTATAAGFQRVNAYANEGGTDTATLTGSGTNQNRFYGAADYAVLSDTPRSFYLYTRGFETATAEVPEGGSGYAYLYDSPDDDLLTATPDTVTLSRAAGTTAATSATATGFRRVYVNATQGGTDTATLTGSDTTQNRFYSYANRAVLTESRSSFYVSARGFDGVSATSPAAATSYAYFYDSTGDDDFTAELASASMDRAESWSDATATGFNRVYAWSILGGDDTAHLTGNATGGNYYRGYSTHSTLNDRAGTFYHYVRGFRSVTAIGSETDSSTDLAYLYDTAGADTLYGRDNRCYLEDTAGATYHNEILYFDYLYARSTDGQEDDTVDVDDSLAYDLILKGIW